MRTTIGDKLELLRLPRSQDLGNYDWFNIEHAGVQVGKSRCRLGSSHVTIFSITIYPEYQRRGYARAVIEHFKGRYSRIVADRVRYTARDFWKEMGFIEEEGGNFVWIH